MYIIVPILHDNALSSKYSGLACNSNESLKLEEINNPGYQGRINYYSKLT